MISSILSQDSERVKVHYVGYPSVFDEWKYENQLVEEEEERKESSVAYQPYSLYV